VLAYRALYYLLPLMGGLVLYLLLERYASAHPVETEETEKGHGETEAVQEGAGGFPEIVA
jgi:hypothetical protein